METEISAERIRADLRQVPLAVLVSVINALLIAAVLLVLAGQRGVMFWVAAVLAVAATRLALWLAHRRAPQRIEAVGRWALPALAGLAGLLWGLGAVLLAPQLEIHRLLWVFVIGGMCAGATALHAAYLPSLLAFLLPACLPVVVALGVAGSAAEQVAAAMIVVFLGALAHTGARSSRAFGETLRLRLDLAARTAALEATSEQLRNSLAEHQATATALRHVQKMEAVGQLAGSIAHDFSNLMTAVLGSLSLLRPRLVAAGDRPALTLLDTAVQGAERGAALTQRLLTFGRRQALRPEAVDPAALIRNMADLLRGSLRPGVTLTLDLPPSAPAVFLDASQLELALLNLARNASDAMPAGGQLAIRLREAATRPDGDAVVVEVADSGEGMDAATLARAMEPFFTTKPAGRGTGLGLSMVHGFAAQSGGRLALRSQKGAGTVVEIWLPRSRGPANPADPQIMARTVAPGPRRVLVVDDDPLVLASTAAMLQDLGHSVIEAPTGALALALLDGGEPVDLMITDQAMPDLTGLQLAAAVQRLRPGLPVLLATADPALVAGAIRLPCLTKPFDQAALARATASCLAGDAGAPPGAA